MVALKRRNIKKCYQKNDSAVTSNLLKICRTMVMIISNYYREDCYRNILKYGYKKRNKPLGRQIIFSYNSYGISYIFQSI